MSRVLLTGSVSLLASALIKKVPKNHQIFLTYHNNKLKESIHQNFPLDICNKSKTWQLISKLNPQIIIHAAAVSDVDWCEVNQKEAWNVNVGGTANIVEAAKKTGSKIIFISTNAVFDGKNPPYSEVSRVNPINFYGKTKVAGEKIVANSGIRHLIFRLITMYGWEPPKARKNPVTWKIEKLKNGEVLKMVNDRFINPLYNMAAADTVWCGIKLEKEGILHVAGGTRVSRFEWATLVAEVFGLDKFLISPISSNSLSDIAPRPADTTYDTGKMETELGIKPLPAKQGLILMRQEKLNFTKL